MSNTQIAVEIAPFVPARGVGAQALLEASDRLERDFLSRLDGYVGRLLVQGPGEQFADIVFWESPDHARRAMQAAAESAACASYFACMAGADHDDPGSGVSLFRALKAYGRVPL